MHLSHVILCFYETQAIKCADFNFRLVEMIMPCTAHFAITIILYEAYHVVKTSNHKGNLIIVPDLVSVWQALCINRIHYNIIPVGTYRCIIILLLVL